MLQLEHNPHETAQASSIASIQGKFSIYLYAFTELILICIVFKDGLKDEAIQTHFAVLKD